jgi:predicted HAD superfamily Cof-like phosphohydrolase
MKNKNYTLQKIQELKTNMVKNQQYENAALVRKIEKSLIESVPFIDEVEKFNALMGKPNNYEPTVPERKEWEFVYNFILEELEEYREACEKGDIVEVLDALCDITYVATGNGTMLHGLKDKIWPAYQEVQASNLSKACQTEDEAKATVIQRSSEQGEECHYEKVGDYFIVYRSRDRKVMKNVNYFKPNLKQFFTEKEIQKSYLKQITGN